MRADQRDCQQGAIKPARSRQKSYHLSVKAAWKLLLTDTRENLSLRQWDSNQTKLFLSSTLLPLLFFLFFSSILYQVLHVISLSLPLWIGRRNGNEKLYIYNCPDIVFMAFLCTWVDEFSPWYLPRGLQVLARVWRFLEPCKRRTASTGKKEKKDQL